MEPYAPRLQLHFRKLRNRDETNPDGCLRLVTKEAASFSMCYKSLFPQNDLITNKFAEFCLCDLDFCLISLRLFNVTIKFISILKCRLRFTESYCVACERWVCTDDPCGAANFHRISRLWNAQGRKLDAGSRIRHPLFSKLLSFSQVVKKIIIFPRAMRAQIYII